MRQRTTEPGLSFGGRRDGAADVKEMLYSPLKPIDMKEEMQAVDVPCKQKTLLAGPKC